MKPLVIPGVHLIKYDTRVLSFTASIIIITHFSSCFNYNMVLLGVIFPPFICVPSKRNYKVYHPSSFDNINSEDVQIQTLSSIWLDIISRFCLYPWIRAFHRKCLLYYISTIVNETEVYYYMNYLQLLSSDLVFGPWLLRITCYTPWFP